jgi:Fe-S oxidoreductase/nitrate reductase gamma subunit
MLTVIEMLVFLGLLGLTVYAFGKPLYLRYRLVRLGQSEKRFDTPLKRILEPIYQFFCLQCSVKKERVFTGLLHIGFLYGAVTFDSVTVTHIFEGFLKNWMPFGHGSIGMIWSVWVDTQALLVFAAVAFFAIRRFILKPKSYSYDTFDSIYIYFFLVTVTVTYLLYEGSLIALHPEHGRMSYLGKPIAAWMQSMFSSHTGLVVNEHINWWLHIINVFAFIAYVPHSKYMHFFVGPINIGFRNQNAPGIVPNVDVDDENAEVFGVETIKEFTWKDLLDGFACMECGRCEDYCPASQTEKPLSPKNVILNLRKALLKAGPDILSKPDAEWAQLMGDVYTEPEIWACTTCGACVHVCPVKNEQFPKLLKLRQGQVLTQGKFPKELKRVFKGLDTNSNPWGMGASTRMDWAKDIEIPLFAEHPEVEYLLFLGCAVSFDDRAQKVGKSLIQFLKKYSISFGILGLDEPCCGETARRVGEENIAKALMTANIELFKELGVKKILTPCPHGYNTFKNEYPLLGGDFQVVHHSELIRDMIANGKIKPVNGKQEKIAIHDSCYLGRMNKLYDPSRTILGSIPGIEVIEPELSREHSFCCGAGGGRFWLEEEEPRINKVRSEQLTGTGSEIVATSCPFCLRMLSDAMKDLGKENIKVMDLLEILESHSG